MTSLGRRTETTVENKNASPAIRRRRIEFNPLILREKRSAASGSTLFDDASFFVSFHPVSGCYGSKMGAEIRAQSPRLSAGAGDLATAILVRVRSPTLMTT